MTILSRIHKRITESCNGRIHTTPGNWVSEVPAKYPPDDHVLKREDATGHSMFLIKQRGVRCTNPDVGQDTFPQSKHSGCWFIPWAFCRKCLHYRKGGTDGLRYPHCNWIRNKLGGDQGAAKNTLQLLQDAAQTANDIIGRR